VEMLSYQENCGANVCAVVQYSLETRESPALDLYDRIYITKKTGKIAVTGQKKNSGENSKCAAARSKDRKSTIKKNLLPRH
jgi:hypothetical protein